VAKLKTFIGNLDGVRSGLVRTTSIVKAAKIVNCSVYSFRQYWSTIDTMGDDLFEPDKLYTRLYASLPGGPWHKGRCPMKEKARDGRGTGVASD